MQLEIDRLVNMYERHTLSRRALVEGLAALALGSRAFAHSAPQDSLVHAHSLNHVTITATDVARSKAFYQTLTGLEVRAEAKNFCELRLEGAFLGLYAPDKPSQRPGFDHFCLGIQSYDAKRVFKTLKMAIPEAEPTLEYRDQVYLRDPDGTRIQLADVGYKH